MTPTKPEDALVELRKQLRRVKSPGYVKHIANNTFSTNTVYVNPNGPEAADAITTLLERERILTEALKPFALCQPKGKHGSRFVIAKAIYEDADDTPREAHWHMSDFDKARAALTGMDR